MVGLCEHGETIGQRVLGDLHEDPSLEIERSEDVPVGQEHLGAPGEEKAAVIQGKVKPGQDPRLHSLLKYISVLRRSNKSTREMGGS